MPPILSKTEHVQELRTWHVPTSLLKDGIYCLLGDRGAGKTTYTEIIFQQDEHKNEAIFVCMCGAEAVKANWHRSIPKIHVIDPDIDFLKDMVLTQNLHIKRWLEMGLPLPNRLYVNLILDDIALFASIMNDATFGQIVAISRNLGMRIIVLAQYLYQIAKRNRLSFNGVGICGRQNEDTLKELHKLYAPFMPRKHFIAAAFTYTQNHGLMMIDRFQQECFKMTMTWPFQYSPWTTKST